MGSGDLELLREIRIAVCESVDLKRDIPDEELKDMIAGLVFDRLRHLPKSLGEKRDIIERVFNSLRRLDILQPFMDDAAVTEIMVNGPENIFIEREGRVSRLGVRFESKQRLEDVIQSIVSKANRAVNEASPIVDARLADGSRVNVVLEPVAIQGPVLTVRKFPETPMTIHQLIRLGSLDTNAAAVLECLVRAKYNIFICGGTGSGKTSLLNALSGFIPPDERLVVIEDSAELQISGIDNIVRLETRNANTEGRGQITIRDLIRTSLRMRPERIIVGEVRGEEALDMLQAMNTGHDGSLSSGHANSAHDMLSRLETMVLAAAPLPLEAIRQQIASAVDIMIYLSRLRDKTRKVMEISEIAGVHAGEIRLNPLFIFEETGELPDGRVAGALRRTGNGMVNTWKFKMAGIECKI